MWDELVIVHAPRTNEHPCWTKLNEQGLSWQTCVRKLALLQQSALPPLPPGLEIYRGEQAYQFLLEVICGLHSPMLGETEVLGQFREFCLTARFPATAWGQFLRRLATKLLTDAKRVRQDHLQKLGGQSYGSLVRQALKGLPTVAMLGAGQLAQEILPYLTSHAEVRVFARNVPRAAAALQAQPGIIVASLSDSDIRWNEAPAGLVIAAPLSAAEISAWLERQDAPFVKTLDLRAESAEDPLWLAEGAVLDLATLFASLQAQRRRLAERAQAARYAVAHLAQRQTRQMQCRPYGWEDVCA